MLKIQQQKMKGYVLCLFHHLFPSPTNHHLYPGSKRREEGGWKGGSVIAKVKAAGAGAREGAEREVAAGFS